ncbi:MAG: hypothetical protein H7Y06_12865 [Opitutaceae bacterium]|nr:hypothetical protein [Opitutaceae bacterium]
MYFVSFVVKKFPHRFLLSVTLCLTLVVTGCTSSPPASTPWTETTPGRWNASVAGWTLTVEYQRARLTELIPPGGTNLLLAGGHRVWLGPQTTWPVFWPAPSDWENSAATAVTRSSDGRTLELTLPRTDPRWPALTRRYTLTRDGVTLIASWTDDGTPRQAIHILQTRADTRVEATATPTESAPLGVGLLALNSRRGLILNQPITADFADPIAPLRWSFHSGTREEKFGLPPQDLRTPDFTLERGQIASGISTAPVDAGLHSQIYLGSPGQWAMVEIEQVSPLLRAQNLGGEVIFQAHLRLR